MKALRLELGNIFIKDMQFGNDTKVENGTLYINKEELLQAVSGDERIKSIDFDIVRPGEEEMCIRDRCKGNEEIRIWRQCKKD